ncbi:MAG TPA: PQQ-binding-like beta-propeller repeat protein [Candidatus Dormibacteraeota bacterium]|jgi:outer membrane protein assembly factor BamB
MRTPRLAAPAVIGTLALVLVGATSAPAGDWRQDGFDAQHTRFNNVETTLSRSNVGHLKRAMVTPVVTGSGPVIVAGTAYLSSSSAGDAQAIDTVTGTVRWTVNACNQGQQTSAPAFAMGGIWVGLDDPAIVGMRSGSGATIACPSPGDLFPTALAAAGRSVYAGGGSGEVVAVDASSGRVRWAVRPHSPVLGASMATPAVTIDGSALLVGSSNGYVYRLAAATGAVVWARYLDSCGESAVTVSGSLLYVSGCNLYALSAATGSVVWQSTHLGPVITAPAVANGLVIAGAAGTYAGLAAFDAATGRRVWSANEFVQDPPTVANGVVYVDAEFSLDMFSSDTGALLGRVSTLSSGYAYQGSPIPVDGRVYLWSDSYLDGTGARLEAFVP